MPALFAVAEQAVPVGPDGTLGTLTNPVRAAGPYGEHEFLARVRCPDSSVPKYERLGSGPTAPDGHIVDTYLVHCEPNGPTVWLVMDMYHTGYRELDSVGPLGVLVDLPGKVATGCPPQVFTDPDSNAAYVFSQFEVEQPAYLLGGEQPPPHPVGIEGQAWVSFVVDTTGIPDLNTISIEHVRPSRLRRHVPDAVRSMRFQPAIHHPGCVVRQQVEGPLEFR